ncbi:ataxin-10 [Amazona aestiva]|uniref:Ataxin-10 n=1 Tax=Amazona aestiva TaxID=12930 RepID=A0A0Q3WK99_AMAAE|nr:ataxin-10 [Amazona aestiva]
MGKVCVSEALLGDCFMHLRGQGFEMRVAVGNWGQLLCSRMGCRGFSGRKGCMPLCVGIGRENMGLVWRVAVAVREMAKESVFQDLLEILRSTSSEIEQAYKDSCELVDLDTCLLLIAECFRCLRNACVECAKNQHVMRNLGLISTSVHLIKLLHGIQIKEELLLTGKVKMERDANEVEEDPGKENNGRHLLFGTCLTYSDKKIVAYCCMVLFTCLNSEKVRELLDPGNLTVALHVLKVYKEQLESEWSFLIVTGYLLKCPELIEALYAKLSNQERVTLLELMMVNVSEKNQHTSEEINLFMRQADFLAGCFQEKYEAVLKLTSPEDVDDEEALVTIRLLDVLCEMTSNNGQLEYLQTLPGLLETAIDTLRLTHLAGKQTVNVFTTTHAMTGQEEVLHPAVDFKSHLIRLIGNLCYKNKENQDKVYLTYSKNMSSPQSHWTPMVTWSTCSKWTELHHYLEELLQELRDYLPVLCSKSQVTAKAGIMMTNAMPNSVKVYVQFNCRMFKRLSVIAEDSAVRLSKELVYELDGIPLILDNCSIDDNNPCILYKRILIIEYDS